MYFFLNFTVKYNVEIIIGVTRCHKHDPLIVYVYLKFRTFDNYNYNELLHDISLLMITFRNFYLTKKYKKLLTILEILLVTFFYK
jgi:hypothetical protein